MRKKLDDCPCGYPETPHSADCEFAAEGKTLEHVRAEDELLRHEMEHGRRYLQAWACRLKDDDLRDVFYFVDGTPQALYDILTGEFDRRRISVDKKGRGTKTKVKKEVRRNQ